MQSLLLGLLASSVSALSPIDNCPPQEELQPCGNAFYVASQYTCYAGNQLCPVLNGVPTQPCGRDCYSETMYSCQNGMLAPPTSSPDNPTTSTFRVVVEYDPTTSYSGDIQANGLVFRIGGDPATYCPLDIEDCPLGIETDWTCSSDICNLNVEVPGGQQIYVAPNGAVSFTQAHSGLAPTGSIFAGFSVEDDGGLTFAGGDFLSCPPVDQTQNYQLYAAAIATPSDDCISIRLLTAATTTDDFGAWQYT